MNQHVGPSGLFPEINLALQPAFALGTATHVRPRNLEIESPGGVTKVEPRVMEVLIALVRADGEAVTRDELNAMCWGGRAVTQDAQNRVVGHLRRVLSSDPSIRIETVTRIGYRLTTTDCPRKLDPAAPAPAAAPREPRAPGRARRAVALALTGLVLAVVVLAMILWPGRDWRAVGVQPVSIDRGSQTHPALSPDGAFLAYAGRDGAEVPRKIFLRNLGAEGALQLTQGEGDDFAPAWSPDGRRLAFIRRRGERRCTLHVLTPPTGAERRVGECRFKEWTRLAWASNDALLYADRPSVNGPASILRLDLRTGATTPVTRPPPEADGDQDPVVAPDGRTVAFVRVMGHGVQDIVVQPLAGDEAARVVHRGHKALGLAFSPDSRTVFFVSNRGTDFGLWAVPTTGGAPKRISLGISAFGRLAFDHRGRLAVETSEGGMQLWSAGAGTAVTQTTAQDWSPDANARGDLVFVSDRSGTPEIWIRTAEGNETRLTDLDASYAKSPRWSPDRRRIAFIAATRAAVHLFTIEADGTGLTQLTDDAAEENGPSWDADGRFITFSRRGPEGWGAWRIDAQGGEPRRLPVPGDWKRLERRPNGGYFGVRSGQSGLWSISATGEARRIADIPSQARSDGWVIHGDHVLVGYREDGGASRIDEIDDDGRVLRTYPAPLLAYSEIAWDPIAGGPIYAGDSSGSRIHILTLQR